MADASQGVPHVAVTRDEFFAHAPKLRTQWVAVPELGLPGGGLMLSQLDGAQAGRLEDALYPETGYAREKARALWIVACARDSKLAALFTDADIPALSALPMPLLDRLSLAARDLNGQATSADQAADVKN